MPDIDWTTSGMVTGIIAVLGWIGRRLWSLKTQLDTHDRQSDRLDVHETRISDLEKKQEHTEDRVNDLLAILSRSEGKIDVIIKWLSDKGGGGCS